MANRFESLADFEIYILDWLHRARTDDELALFDVSLFWLYHVDEVIDDLFEDVQFQERALL